MQTSVIIHHELIREHCSLLLIAKLFLSLSCNKMADVLPLIKVESVPNMAHEIAIKRKPQGSKASNGAMLLDAPAPLMEIPVIDIGLLTSPSTSTQELEKLHSAICSWGCFQAINHGIPTTSLEKMLEISKQFFALPEEYKQKLAREGGIDGYRNDKSLTDQDVAWTDRLYLQVLPEEERKLRFWPEAPQDFRGIIDDYSMKTQELIEILLKAMASSMNLKESCFLDVYGEHSALYARFNYYPPCPHPDRIIGLKPHTDGCAISILLQDGMEGLQFLQENQWVRPPFIPNSLLVILGDVLQIISNGIFKSAKHRVVTNSEKERLSVAMFGIPDPEKQFEPLKELVDDTRPKLYGTMQNYTEIFFRYYRKDRSAVEELKI